MKYKDGRVGMQVRSTMEYYPVTKGMVGKIVLRVAEGFHISWVGLTNGHDARGNVQDKSGYYLPATNVEPINVEMLKLKKRMLG